MIQIKDKHLCCGCGACVASCPMQCVHFQIDEEGFLYPEVDTSVCIDCGKCERFCPVINKQSPVAPVRVLAAKNKNNEIIMNSSSGGLFTAVAEKCISSGGVVYGAAFDPEWKLRHIAVEELSELSYFQGSKYLQSEVVNVFSSVKEYLKEGRQVVFSGTPCQIAGLKRFLNKEYDNLLAVEIVCHGVPSPKIFREYLARCLNSRTFSDIVEISFRDKREDWVNYHFVVKTIGEKGRMTLIDERASQNLYMQSFLKNYNMRPSCYQCAFKSGSSTADITLADFWGIWDLLPEFYDKYGVSAVFINTDKGDEYINSLDVDSITIDSEDIFSSNSSLHSSPHEPSDRNYFWESWSRGDYKTVEKMCLPTQPSIIRRIINRIIK